ncbi:hypothetical protein ANO11243_076450 [Dothideomycetidae sp. 11243]|nr:hypothetical protein ANO11243_076450 [fungal sp. No.11243]
MACGICHQPFASGFQEAAPSGFNTWSNAGHGPQTPSSRAGASPTSVYNSAFTHPMLQSGKSGFAFPSAMYGQPSPHDQIRSHFLEDPFVAAEGEKPKTQPVPSPSALAEMIKSGAFEDPDDPPIDAPSNRGHMGHNGIAPIALPLVQLWGSHMVAPVAIPPFLAEARSGQRPSFELAMDHQPFTLPGESIPVAQNGVVLVKNIPYGSTKAEIIAAIGRNSRIVAQPPGSPFYAIHIIMERSTGKTMDCYVELESSSEARGILYSYRSRCDRGRTPRVGERHVEVELSSQEALMEQIFPKARCVTWQGQEPHIYQPKEAYNSGFMGFITVEECAMIVKHAENPSRYPWFKSELITLGERALLFRTACGLLKVLCRSVASRSSPGQLSQILLQELLCATLTVPFSHKQKNEIAELAAANGFGALVASIGFIPMLHYGNFWPFEALDKKPGVRDEVVELTTIIVLRLPLPRSNIPYLSGRALQPRPGRDEHKPLRRPAHPLPVLGY